MKLERVGAALRSRLGPDYTFTLWGDIMWDSLRARVTHRETEQSEGWTQEVAIPREAFEEHNEHAIAQMILDLCPEYKE